MHGLWKDRRKYAYTVSSYMSAFAVAYMIIRGSVAPNDKSVETEVVTSLKKDAFFYDYSVFVDKTTNFSSIVTDSRLSRAYDASYPNFDWCSTSYNKASPTGLLYVKTPKAASSTTAGIALRISQRLPRAQNRQTTVSCNAHVEHIPDYKVGNKYGNRDKTKSFLFATVRDPAKRAISRIFFGDVSLNKHEPTDENILRWLSNSDSQKGAVSPGKGGFQLAYLSLTPIRPYSAWTSQKVAEIESSDTDNEVLDPNAVHADIKRIIDQYDFLIVVERFDESLVAMQLLLDLSPTDFLYLTSKHAGDYWMNRKGKCVQLHETFVSRAVAKHLDSPMWYAQNYGDYLLHEAAKQSLDLTIQQLGQHRFQQALDEFILLKERADEECSQQAIFPCSPTGKPQSKLASTHCYQRDWGCGYPCLDKFVDEGSITV